MSADAITKAIAIMERDREALRASHGHPAHGGAIPAEDADATAADAEYGDAIAALRASSAQQPAFWTTMAHVDAAKAGKPLHVHTSQGVEFCVPVHFGKPQPADDFAD